MSKQHHISDGDSNRRKLLMGLGLLSVFSFLSFRSPGRKKINSAATPQTARMLTQDGQLVEVDLSRIVHSSDECISDKDLKEWIKR